MWITQSGRLIIGAHQATQDANTSSFKAKGTDDIGMDSITNNDHVCLTCNE